MLDQNTLKNVGNDVVAEEDRGRNLIVFELPENPADQISEKVGEVNWESTEQPKFEAVRIGLETRKENLEQHKDAPRSCRTIEDQTDC